MKIKAVLLLSLTMAVAFAMGQDTIRFTRHLKEGDSDNYKMHISGTMQAGDLDMQMKMNQTVKKVYDNGDADMTATITDFHITMGGNEIPVPAPPPSNIKVDKYGIPKDMPQGVEGRMQFMRYITGFYDKDLKVGDVIPINTVDPKEPKNTAKGTVKLDAVANGQATLIVDLTTTSADSDTPSKFHMTSYLDVNSSKMNKVEGTVDNIPMPQGMMLTDVKVNMERVTAN